MWLWILAVLLIAAVWVAGYFLPVGLLIKVAITVAILLAVIAVVLLRRWRAVRAAQALEREILKQAEMHAATVRPDRRAEVLALREQIKKGLEALRRSKLAGASGGGALYALPWYMIVGPPGAGKTTALRHSGLVFPFLDPTQGGLKGVGGTRNCDWWFTNEAVILDTAGRYATEDDDQDEWMAFLDMLKKYRPHAPINGMIVAISLADLAGADEEHVDMMAKTLRKRLDELIGRLQMIVPVYVMFTKADLIGGFVEFWEDLRKSERAQIWGASFAIPTDGTFDVARAFDAEYLQLVERLQGRAVERLRAVRRGESRAKVLQFPMEFAALQGNLSQFLGTLFLKNAYQETPVFRGAYFTSGTQEGRPLDRVMAQMAKAFGLHSAMPNTGAPVADPKSYFLTDLFQKVMFPDRELAVRTSVEARRRLLTQIGVGAGASLLAGAIVVPSALSYSSNRSLVSSVREASELSLLNANEPRQNASRLAKASELRDCLERLNVWEETGVPLGYRFGMYTGSSMKEAALGEFAAFMQGTFVRSTKSLLEGKLATFASAGELSPDLYARYYETLKLYLMLTEQVHLEPDWASPRLAQLWNDQLRTDGQGQKVPESLARSYLVLQKKSEVQPALREEQTIGKARAQLKNTPRMLGDYAVLLNEARAGLAPVSRSSVFSGSSADPFVLSRNGIQVDGVYTAAGWLKVRGLFQSLGDKLKAEEWVLGEGSFDPAKAVAEVRSLYFSQYTASWDRFIGDLQVRKPANVDDSLPELLSLTEPEWPYLRLIRTVRENVVIEVTASEVGQESSLADDAKALAEKAKALIAGDAGALAIPKFRSPMERTFKSFVEFGVSSAPEKQDEPPPPTALGQYEGVLRKLVAALTDHKQKGASARGDIKALEVEFQSAYQATMQQVAGQDAHTRDLLQSLLLDPITMSWSSVVSDAGGATGGFWEMGVFRPCDAKINGRFPFDLKSAQDARVEDFTEFFRPKEGTLWGFYEQNLKGGIERRGDQYVAGQRFGQKAPFSGDFLEFLKRSDDITQAFFASDAKTPSVTFEINLHTVSPEVSEVTFEIDGQSHTYKNTPEDWMSVTWPSKDAKARGAKLRVRGFSGLNEEILRMGEFGFFRLLAEGNLKPNSPKKAGEEKSYLASWNMRSQRAKVQMDLRPTRSDNPFERGFLTGYKCPRLITTEGAK